MRSERLLTAAVLGFIMAAPLAAQDALTGVGPATGWRAEEDVVAGVRIKRRVEVDQVHARIGDVLAQHLEIVAVIERVGHWAPLIASS